MIQRFLTHSLNPILEIHFFEQSNFVKKSNLRQGREKNEFSFCENVLSNLLLRHTKRAFKFVLVSNLIQPRFNLSELPVEMSSSTRAHADDLSHQ